MFGKLEEEYAKAYLNYEIALHTKSRGRIRKHKEISVYFSSTKNRRLFGLHCIRAYYDGTPALVTDIAHNIRISRTAMDKMVAECEAAGWITIDRSEANHRYISASFIIVDAWLDYVQFIRPISQSTKMGEVNSAIKNLQSLAILDD